MRIGVFSDTHGLLHFIDKAMEIVGPVDLVFHAGDVSPDADYIREAYRYKVYGVSGNCDTYSDYPGERLIKLEGKKIFLTHGHAYRVKYGYDRLLARAKELSADIVVFGHTHCPENVRASGILIFNPGSLALPRCGKRPTFGILEINEGEIKSSINEL
ncbi:MAG: uncharacterized protein PWP45_978 [Tepidanaerobacteraceae bacterium]|nr:uncharacterized protein [Tepidanaerobacteraceae bacterium]